MKILRSFAVASAAFFYIGTASAQWQTPDHSVPVGRGSGTGFKFAAPGAAGQTLVSNGASSDPSFQAISGPAFGTQTANTHFSGPTSGGAANPTFRALVGADLPNPSASTLGGVQSKAAVTSQWLNSISTSGVPSSTQPAFTDISGTATAAQGGTGQSVFVIGDLLQANATNTLARLAAVATGNVLLSGGVGVISSWGKVGLATHVSGTLPVANGGTNCAVASGTCVDNISGFSSTGFLTRTGAGAYAFQSATNGITRGNLAQVAANSFSGNSTTSLANEAAFTITSLTSKASPVSGDLVIIEDSAAAGQLKKVTVGSIASAGSVASFNGITGAVTTSIVVQKFTASGTYTPTAGMLHAVIECLGGGGGGGGSTNSAVATVSQGASGSGGGRSVKYTTAAAVGASQVVTIGAAGAAGGSGTAGGNGGATSVGSLCTANGGIGGPNDTARASATVAAVGTGDVTSPGQVGSVGIFQLTGSMNALNGANTLYGGGGVGAFNVTGGAATGFGASGAGGHSFNALGAQAGGAGAPGIVIITEYVNL